MAIRQLKKDRGRDRHSKQHPRYSPDFEFVAIDGEGIKTKNGDRYVLLGGSGMQPLIDLKGLTTRAICDWLMTIDKDACIVGYGLNYDFENFLVDLSPLEYTNLVNGYAIYHEGYTLSLVPKKILRVLEGDHVSADGTLRYAAGERRTIYNCIAFFQSTFVKALQSFGLDHYVTAEIESGKAARGTFTARQIKTITKYNAQECIALRELMTRFWHQCRDGFRAAHVPVPLRKRDAYGPGAFASRFLREIAWRDEHPQPWPNTAAFLKDLDRRLLKGIDALEHDEQRRRYIDYFPFSASFFGGRIELAAVGQFESLHSYDIVSAYPAAMTRLPTWDPGDAVYSNQRRWIDHFIAARSVCMILVSWEFPAGWTWYPFPYRSHHKNVFFPRDGLGWIMSPEYFAAIDTGLGKYIKTHGIYYLRGTKGYGDGLTVSPSASAAQISNLFTLRAQFKKSDDPTLRGAQLPLKLTLNSCYGKLMQQIGATIDDPRLFCDVAAAWITSWTRAMLWRAIASRARERAIVAIQTDGIYSREPLDVAESAALGGWEYKRVDNARMLLPGIYQYDVDGRTDYKRRGQTRHFEFDRAWAVLEGAADRYVYKYPAFISTRHALSQPQTFGHLRLQWTEIEKEYAPDLSSKRAASRALRLNGAPHVWTRPKRNPQAAFCSRPFTLKFGRPDYLMMLDDTLLEDAEDDDYFVAGIQE